MLQQTAGRLGRPDTGGDFYVRRMFRSGPPRIDLDGTVQASRGAAPITRVTGFLWDRGGDRLWRQGIDLIGDDRGGQVGKGIEDGAVFGQSEGGEFLEALVGFRDGGSGGVAL